MWFSGVRGSMAFALAIKSKDDFIENGPIFLLLTLLFSFLSIIYSSLFMHYTLKKCDMNIVCEADNFEDSSLKHKNPFEKFKMFIEEYNQYLQKLAYREIKNENIYLNLREINDENKSNSLELKLENIDSQIVYSDEKSLDKEKIQEKL